MAQLQDLFQTHAVVKILDHFTLYKDFEYTRTDVAKETGISRRTLYQVWPVLERFDLVKVTKSSGMIKFYKLNTENPISKQLVALADKISFFKADKIAGADLPLIPETYVSKARPPQLDERSEKISVSMIKVEGTPEEVVKYQKMLDLTNGETKVPVTDSTMSRLLKTRVHEGK